ncbi:hypothetical protein [Paenibacillus sp. GYB003]|uniref:hypothetical protein n=1 Tax=Paenibacillus sp. GYB003 TaxID=2994392 RepID=UPI002F963BB4
MIRKTLYVVAALLLAVVLACGAALWYARPSERLDLAYEPVSVAQKVVDMVKVRKPELTISEKELNDILKKELAKRAQVRPDVTIEGARFEQRANRVTAYVNVKAAGRVEVGAAVDFALEWKPPNLIVRPEETRIRSLRIPASWLPLEPIVVRVDESLPPPIGIRDIRFEPRQIVVSLKLS